MQVTLTPIEDGPVSVTLTPVEDNPEASWGEIITKAGKTVLPAASQAVGGLIRAAEDVIPDSMKARDFNSLGKQTADYWGRKIEENQPEVVPGSLKHYASMVLQNVAQNVPTLAVGAATGTAAVPLTAMGLQAGGQKYQQMREAGQSPGVSGVGATITGVSEAATELLPFEELIKPGVTFAKRLVMSSAFDVPGELINTSIESAVDKVTINPGMTWEDYGKALADTAIVSLASAGLLTSIAHPIVRARESTTPPPLLPPLARGDIEGSGGGPISVTLTPVEDILAEGEVNRREYIEKVKGEATPDPLYPSGHKPMRGEGSKLGEVVGYNAKDGKPIIDMSTTPHPTPLPEGEGGSSPQSPVDVYRKVASENETFDDFVYSLVRHGEYPQAVKQFGNSKGMEDFYNSVKNPQATPHPDPLPMRGEGIKGEGGEEATPAPIPFKEEIKAKHPDLADEDISAIAKETAAQFDYIANTVKDPRTKGGARSASDAFLKFAETGEVPLAKRGKNQGKPLAAFEIGRDEFDKQLRSWKERKVKPVGEVQKFGDLDIKPGDKVITPNDTYTLQADGETLQDHIPMRLEPWDDIEVVDVEKATAPLSTTPTPPYQGGERKEDRFAGAGKEIGDVSLFVDRTLDRQYREVRVPVKNDVFAWLGVKPDKVFADYINLQKKHPEYFSTPEDVKKHVEYVLAGPNIVLPATKEEYTLLIRKNGDNKATVVEFVLKGGKYRVRSAHIITEKQLEEKIKNAQHGGRKPLFRGEVSLSGEISHRATAVPSDTHHVEPSSKKNIPSSSEDVKAPEKLVSIIREIERIAAPGVKVEAKERITLDPAQRKVALEKWGEGADSDVKIRGAHRVVNLNGEGFRSLIELSLENMNLKTTPYHEAFHSAQEFLLTDEEMGRLEERFPDRDGVSSSERQAEAFADYAAGRQARYPVWVREIFARIKNFLDGLRSYLKGQGFTGVNDIFEKAYAGELKERATTPPPLRPPLARGDIEGSGGDALSLDIEERTADATERLMQKINPKAADNVKVQGRRKDLGFVKGLIGSPGAIEGKARYYVVHAKNAVHKQDRLRGIIDEKLGEIFRPLKTKELRAEFEALSWLGDAEGKNYTAEELSEMGVSSTVKDAYLKHRKFHDQVWRLLASHRKAYGGETGHREGHIPHLFENWNVYEEGTVPDLRDEQGEAVESGLSPEKKIAGTFRSLKEATAFANSLSKEKNYLIRPKTFQMPDALIAKTVMKDASYFRLVEKMEKGFELTRDEAFEMTNEVARRKNRRRFFGNVMQRTGQSGFRKGDLHQILKEYYNSTARYMALDDFKAKVVPKFEKDFGVELGRATSALRDKNTARYVEEYVNDVNGAPGMIEELLDSSIKNAFGKHIRSERPAIWAVNKALHATAVLKLGLFNLSAGVVNLSQLINTFSKVPAKHFAGAFKSSFHLSESERAILRRIGVDFDLGLSDTGGYSMTHKGGKVVRASMFFFQAAEHINRRITALAAYRHAGKDLGMGEQAARHYARELIDRTQFDYSVADTARIFRNPAGRLLGQFKPYAIKEIEFITGLKGAENVKFWIPFLLMAGTAGVPLIEGLSDLIEWLTGKNPLIETKKFLMEWAGDDKEKKRVAEVAMYGIASQIGVDMSRRVGTGDMLPKRGTDLLGPTLNTLMNAKELLSGDKTELVRSLAPSVGNLVTAIETAMNGMDVADPYHRERLKYTATPSEVAVKGMGFRPLRESKLSDIEQIRQYETGHYTKAQQRYVDDAIESIWSGDAEGFAEATTKAAEEGVIVDSKAIENEMVQKLLPQELRTLLKTRNMLKGGQLDRMEFLRE